MQLRYVFTELRSGLRRNLSMHIAVILTLSVSLTLAGCGILFQREADKTAEALGNELQILINLCAAEDTSDSPNCAGGAVTDQQDGAVTDALDANPEVESYDYRSPAEGFERAKENPAFEELLSGPDPLFTAETWPGQYLVTLTDPEEADGIISAVQGLDGVSGITDLRDELKPIFSIMDALKYGSWIGAALLLLASMLQVATTIRLAAMARRREIGIMRLVGASTLYIALPFLLESLVAAIVGVGFAAAALAAFTKFAIMDGLAGAIEFVPWVGWDDYVETLIGTAPPGIVFLGPALTLIPTLLLTRKYIKV